MTTATLEPEVDPMLGRFVGKYQIIRKLGEGGMGVVYVGKHPVLGTERAIKTLKAEALANREVVSRFIGEARGAAAIKHPGIIDIHDVDKLEDGRPYIVMELLDGADVERMASEQQQPLLWVFSVIVQALDALHAAHERGIIHRDLKPPNLFVLRDGGRVKVLDFGIAKLLDPELAGGVHTATKMVAGTLGYMAPEQARALTHVDRRADLFSIGVIMYELVTGIRPWPADSYGDYVYHVNSTPLTHPRVYRADLPAAWNALIVECLSVQPEQRPATAREVAQRLIAATPGPDAAKIVERFAAGLLGSLPEQANGTRAASVDTGSTPPRTQGHATVLAGALPTAAPGARRRSWFGPALIAVGVASGAAATIALTTGGGGRGDERAASTAPTVDATPDADAVTAMTGVAAATSAAVTIDAAELVDAPTALPLDAPTAVPLDAAPVDAAPAPDAGSATRVGTREPRAVGEGSLHVYVVPWAEVWLDNKPLGQTPVRVDNLAAGRHTVRLQGAEKRETVKVTITDKQTTTLRRTWPTQ